MSDFQGKVDAAKASGHSVFKVKLGSNDYVYRSINRQEFRSLQRKMMARQEDLRSGVDLDDPKQMASLEAKVAALKEEGEEEIVVLGLISPQVDTILDLNSLPAGVIATLTDKIMDAAGFGAEAEVEAL